MMAGRYGLPDERKKKKVKRLSSYILATLVVLLLHACSTEDDFMGTRPQEESEVYVNVTFSLGGSTEMTRATITPDQVGGDGLPGLSMGGDEACDYFIDPWDVDILLFTRGTGTGGDGVFVDRVNVVPFWISEGKSEDGSHYVYYYTLRGSVQLDESALGQNYQLMAVCNMGRQKDGFLYTTDADGAVYSTGYTSASHLVKGTTTRDAFIQQLRFKNYSGAFTQELRSSNDRARIPMWGIREVTISSDNDANNFSMDLLRAMAKVRVSLSDELYTQGYRLTWVGMTRAHTQGYLAAQDGQAARLDGNVITTNYNSDTNVRISRAAAAPGGDVLYDDLSFMQIQEHKSHIFYMPEYVNTDAFSGVPLDAAQQTAMTLQIKKLTGGDWATAKDITYGGQYPQLHFADYSLGTLPTQSTWDVIRNDFYDYTITHIVEESVFMVNLKVVPWFEYKHSGVVM